MDEKWITHRQPTEADMDLNEEVYLRQSPDRERAIYVHYKYVGAGVPWKHTELWQPPTPPAEDPAAEPAKPEPKPVETRGFLRIDLKQIDTSLVYVAIATDNTAWIRVCNYERHNCNYGTWVQVDPLPQPGEE